MMTEEEKDKYIGYWHSYEFLFRNLVVGDLVIFDDDGHPIITEITKIDEDGYYYYYPEHGREYALDPNMIIAVREDI